MEGKYPDRVRKIRIAKRRAQALLPIRESYFWNCTDGFVINYAHY